MAHESDAIFQNMANTLSEELDLDSSKLFEAVAIAQMGELNCMKAGLLSGVASPVYWSGVAYGLGMVSRAKGSDFVASTDAVLKALEEIIAARG